MTKIMIIKMITIYDKDNANNNDNDSDRECSMNNDNGHATLAGNGTTLTWILDKDSDIATYSDSCYFNNALFWPNRLQCHLLWYAMLISEGGGGWITPSIYPTQDSNKQKIWAALSKNTLHQGLIA